MKHSSVFNLKWAVEYRISMSVYPWRIRRGESRPWCEPRKGFPLLYLLSHLKILLIPHVLSRVRPEILHFLTSPQVAGCAFLVNTLLNSRGLEDSMKFLLFSKKREGIKCILVHNYVLIILKLGVKAHKQQCRTTQKMLTNSSIF